MASALRKALTGGDRRAASGDESINPSYSRLGEAFYASDPERRRQLGGGPGVQREGSDLSLSPPAYNTTGGSRAGARFGDYGSLRRGGSGGEDGAAGGLALSDDDRAPSRPASFGGPPGGRGPRAPFLGPLPLTTPPVYEASGRQNLARKARKSKRSKSSAEEPVLAASERGRLASYCTCNELNTEALLAAVKQPQGKLRTALEFMQPTWRHTMYLDVLHSTAVVLDEDGRGGGAAGEEEDEGRSGGGGGGGGSGGGGGGGGGRDEGGVGARVAKTYEIFFFPYGCIVFWGFSELDERMVLDIVAGEAFSEQPVNKVEMDDTEFMFGPKSRVSSDVVCVQSDDPIEKLAISFACAQSVKLSIFEARVDETINSTRHMPQSLARTGSIALNQRDISRQIGQLFIERNSVNLYTDMLDTPEFFWDQDEWEPLYASMHKLLDIMNRVNVLNRRLDIIRELLDLVSGQLQHQHDSKLEWIIIWLIVVEVVIQVVWNMLIKDILGLYFFALFLLAKGTSCHSFPLIATSCHSVPPLLLLPAPLTRFTPFHSWPPSCPLYGPAFGPPLRLFLRPISKQGIGLGRGL
jgi:uncharacterized Rmd1/YagE family protein